MAVKGNIKYYDNFRGIDYTEKSYGKERRSPDMVNIYKDYSYSKGKALETIPGFRKRVVHGEEIIDFYVYNGVVDGQEKSIPILHVGENLYLWKDYPNDLGVDNYGEFEALNGEIALGFNAKEVKSVEFMEEEVIFSFTQNSNKIFVDQKYVGKCKVCYVKNALLDSDLIASNVGNKKLNYFTYKNTLYILGNGKYFAFDGKELSQITPYIPTTYIGISESSQGEALDFRNVLTDCFYNTIIANGTTKTFYLSEKDLKEVLSVEVYGEVITDYTVDLEKGAITFTTAPKSPENAGFDHGTAGIKVLAKRSEDLGIGNLTNAKRCAMTEGRLLLACENGKLYYSALDNVSYFPEVKYLLIGDGISQIVSILPIGSEIFVFLEENKGGGVYLLTKAQTEHDLNPIVYTSSPISQVQGAYSNAVEFEGTAHFLTKEGLKAITSPNLKLDRAIERRSTLINKNLLIKNLSNSNLFVFDGYLCIYCDGEMYMGDCREVYKNERGEFELEWFKVDGIGLWQNQYKKYVYCDCDDKDLVNLNCINQTANEPNFDGNPTLIPYVKEVNGKKIMVVNAKIDIATDIQNGEIVYKTEYKEYAVKGTEEYIGGKFIPAKIAFFYEDNVWFIANNVLYSFNFDLKKQGKEDIYDFDGRTIFSYVFTMPDNLGYPDCKKSVISKSLVIKALSKPRSKIKVKSSKLDGKFYLVGEIYAGLFDFNNVDFQNLSFNTAKSQVFVLNDRDKNWLEKQLLLYSDEYKSAFALEYLSFRYKVKGKIK